MGYHDPSIQVPANRRPSDPSPVPMAVPQRSAERDKSSIRQHRSHRDRVAGQGSGQESSSEQEQSLRERYRPSERRHATKERKDVYVPSGSETERESMRDRRKHARTHADLPGHAKSATESNSKPTEAQLLAANYKASRMQQVVQPQDNPVHRPVASAPASMHAPVPPSGQPTVPGPADPQTPLMVPKSPSTGTVNRPREQAYPYTDPANHYEPHSYTTPSAEYPAHNGDTLKRSRHANPAAQLGGNVQQPTYVDSTHATAYTNSASAGYLHPVQQVIRSVEGIMRPPSTRPGAKTPSTSAAAAQATTLDPSARYTTNAKEYERSYAQKLANTGGAYGQAPGQQPHSTPQYSTSDVRLPGAYPSSPAHVPQPPMHPNSGPIPGSYGVPGVATTNNSHNDEKTPRARPVELSVQYQTSTYPSAQNGNAYDSAKMPSAMSPTTHSITVAHATFAPARPPSAAPEAKAQWSTASPGGLASPPPTRYADPRPTQDGHMHQQGAGGNSPGRQPASHVGRSPGVASAAQLEATPRQYSASQLPTHKNGSTDTIQQSGVSKYSPSLHQNQQTLNHRTSVGSMQPHAPSRPDMTPTARPSNVLSGYPEPPTRYRSPAPIPIPYRAPSTAPISSTTASQSYSAPPSSRPTLPPSGSAPVYEPSLMSPRGAAAQMAQPQPTGTRGYQQPAMDYNTRAQEPYSTAGQRPPRSVPPPAPTMARQQYDISSPAGQQSVLPPSSAPPRSSTFPTQTRRPPESGSVPPTHHSRASSEPHYPASTARQPLSVQTNTAHIKSRSATHASAAASDQDLLLTPSSLAPSMLPRQPSNASSFLPPGSRGAEQKLTKDKEKDKDKDSRKKGGFFSGINLFRSRSNPQKPLQETLPDAQREVRTRKRQDSAPAASSMRPPQTSHTTTPQAARQEAYDTLTSPRRRDHVEMPVQAAPPTPAMEYLTVPSAGMGLPSAMPTSGGRSPTKMFSPFRLLSKRHRTVSAASVEAVDGTVANTVTGADSTRSSTAGRLSPPLRDPQAATQEWRSREAADLADRGTGRRRRPGVTFDVDADTPEKTTTIRAQSRGARSRQPQPIQEQ
ncbi:hypothetical protein DAEQUDRAFT_377805 [Daedalea quercina L-15889]|uniref:Uncharacterized protein n=1 Tax=Daedalea quercina L-15889 TaxID=1314783 RepID=A0A165P3G5_9APHY|nr:hypothetical protein DAEQUDRAFT_377805 [Daedalea quercina L-15889]